MSGGNLLTFQHFNKASHGGAEPLSACGFFLLQPPVPHGSQKRLRAKRGPPISDAYRLHSLVQNPFNSSCSCRPFLGRGRAVRLISVKNSARVSDGFILGAVSDHTCICKRLLRNVLMGHGLADFELDMSSPCFPDVVTIWGGVSKQVQQLLMLTKVGLHPTPPLIPRLQ